ncbi:MAG: hypothetical protein WAO28_01725 [Candidatus Microsaccharimonas sp.]
MKKRLAIFSAAVFITVATLLSPVPQIFAQEGSGGGLEISPALVELNGEPGKDYTINLSVLNVTENELVFNSMINDFGSKDESGSPGIILDSDIENPLSIKSWVSEFPEFTLKAKEKKKLVATVSIPNDAIPGGHYGVIRFSGRNPAVGTDNVNLTASAGTLILVRVAGADIEKLELPTFEASKNGKAGGSFEAGPITFVTRFENKGTVHVKPIGQIEVKDMFGNKVDVLPINSAGGNVLPGSIRRFEATLDKSFLFGKYTADLTTSYGTRGGAIVESISFWVIPYKIILVVLVGLITVIYILRGLVKRYNSYIIRSANNKHDKKTHNKKK